MTEFPKCYDEKNPKTHNGDYLEEIYRFGNEDHENYVVRWCPECGAVVIDEEMDNRMCGSAVPMKFPKTLSSILKDKKS